VLAELSQAALRTATGAFAISRTHTQTCCNLYVNGPAQSWSAHHTAHVALPENQHFAAITNVAIKAVVVSVRSGVSLTDKS
jgi:threonine aldolase